MQGTGVAAMRGYGAKISRPSPELGWKKCSLHAFRRQEEAGNITHEIRLKSEQM